MRKICLLLILCIAVSATPVLAAKVASSALVHQVTVFQAYPGTAAPRVTDGAADLCWLGYLPQAGATITAVPGVLCIDPGCQNWCNFVRAAQTEPAVDYTVKNTTLVKATPAFIQCGTDATGTPIFPAITVTQQGTSNIRTWWPLMYEVPGTTFTLTILYGTGALFDDDGAAGPNPPAWVHVEQWIWTVAADFESLHNELALFHETPFGKSEVPLISDETLLLALQQKIALAQQFATGGDLATASLILADFELEVMDACIDETPAFPNPTGPGTGIANTTENPACCKLLVDAEYLLRTTGIGQPKKGR